MLIASAAVALLVAKTPLQPAYRAALQAHLAGLDAAEWINHQPMALFPLVVGLGIKREVLHGQLRTWTARTLPGLAALGDSDPGLRAVQP